MKLEDLKPGMVVEYKPYYWWNLSQAIIHLSLKDLWENTADTLSRANMSYSSSLPGATYLCVVLDCYRSKTDTYWIKLISPELGVIIHSQGAANDDGNLFRMAEEACPTN